MHPVTALNSDAPIVTIMPTYIPAGVTLRYHVPVGAAASAFVGFGVATQVFNVETTNLRLEPQNGVHTGNRGQSLSPSLNQNDGGGAVNFP